MLIVSSELPIIPFKIHGCVIGDEIAIIDTKKRGKKGIREGKILAKFYRCSDGYLLSYDVNKVTLDKDMKIGLMKTGE